MPDARAASAVLIVYDDNRSISTRREAVFDDRANSEQLHEPLLTADDIAAWLAVPRSSVYEYARREHKPLPAVRIGRHLRFLRHDVAAWLGAQREVRDAVPAPAQRRGQPVPPAWWRAHPPQ